MTLAQQRNYLRVTGLLKSSFIDHKIINNMDTITGNVIIEYKENDRVQNHRINIFAPSKTKAGKDMPSYKSASKVETDFKDADRYSKDQADRITVTGSLDYHVYTDKQGEVRKSLRLSGDFFSRVKDGDQDTIDGANAELVIGVTGYEDEIQNGVPTGNKVIKNVNVGYNDRINTLPKLKFDMNELGDSVSDIASYYPAGSVMPIDVKLNNYAETTQSSNEAHGFGKKTQIATAKHFVHENVITFVSTDRPQYGNLSSNEIMEAKKLLDKRVQPEPKQNPFASNNFSDNNNQITDADMPF